MNHRKKYVITSYVANLFYELLFRWQPVLRTFVQLSTCFANFRTVDDVLPTVVHLKTCFTNFCTVHNLFCQLLYSWQPVLPTSLSLTTYFTCNLLDDGSNYAGDEERRRASPTPELPAPTPLARAGRPNVVGFSYFPSLAGYNTLVFWFAEIFTLLDKLKWCRGVSRPGARAGGSPSAAHLPPAVAEDRLPCGGASRAGQGWREASGHFCHYASTLLFLPDYLLLSLTPFTPGQAV